MKSFSYFLFFILSFFILSCQDNSPQDIFRNNCENYSFKGEELIIKNCQLDSISLENQHSEKISFDNSILKNSSFKHTKFTNSSFTKTHFINSNFENAIFKDCELSGVKFKKCNLTNTHFLNRGVYVFNDCYAMNADWLEHLAIDWGMKMDEMSQYYRIQPKENSEGEKYYLITMIKPPFAREEILRF